MNTLALLIGALCIFALGYRFYAAFLAARVLTLDDARQTPAHTCSDGQAYMASPKIVLFGHHFAAIAGAGPLIGPTLAAQFGLVYTIPEQMRDYYQSIYIDLEFINGDQSWQLPLPATYLIGQDGRVLFAEADADFRVRPEPADILAALDRALGR